MVGRGTLALILGLAGPATAAPAPFTFRAVEFEPAEQRVPLAEAFVARVAAAGTPLPVAVAAIRRADAACAPGAASGDRGATICRSSRMVSRSELDTGVLDDVTWTVRVVPGPDGRVAGATVARTFSGE